LPCIFASSNCEERRYCHLAIIGIHEGIRITTIAIIHELIDETVDEGYGTITSYGIVADRRDATAAAGGGIEVARHLYGPLRRAKKKKNILFRCDGRNYKYVKREIAMVLFVSCFI
jgi:hypothetical protein